MDRAEAIKELMPFTLCDVYSDNLREACRMAIAALREQSVTDRHQLTNADRIRAMTDEELERFLGQRSLCSRVERCPDHGECHKCVLELLQQPCGGADHDAEEIHSLKNFKTEFLKQKRGADHEVTL